MDDKISDLIARAVAASKSPHDAAASIRQSLEQAGYVITRRPEVGEAPHGFMPVFRASDK